ncbi:MAG: ABC transporter permease [Longimicrobiales bacterium]|nr:ABC transporter permease [Longimicrobiales bacterium]
MRRLLEGWLRAVSLVVPAAERGRWREEWLADIDDARAAGASPGQLVSLAAGMTMAAMNFRFEGMTMDGWTKEVMHAMRGLLRRPAFTVIAVLTLGLGIGANTAIFSVVNGVVLEPLRYPDSGELVMLTSAFPSMNFDEFWISPPEYMQVSEHMRSFESVGAYATYQASIGADEQPERVDAAGVSHSLFATLGVSPVVGRYFSQEEDQPGAAPVAVLSHELWQRSFGADPSVVGRAVEVNGQSTTIVGVMPEGFDVNETGAQIWAPLNLDWSNRNNFGSHYLYLVARLGQGATLEGASRELETLVARWDEEVGSGHVSTDGHPLQMVSLQEEVVGDIRPALMVLLGAVGFVLLIACANVANLLLARAQDRHKEVAVRAAMGAGHGRLLRQFLTEGLVLSLSGALLGTGLAIVSLDLLQAASPGDLPRLSEVRLDGTVLGFTTGIAILTGLFFGLAPTRHVATSDLARSLRDGGTRSTSSAGQRRLRSLLVVSETALALILAVGAGLMIRSFSELNAVEPGFDPQGKLTFQIYLPASDYPDGESQLAFQTGLRERLAAEPGVTGVAAMSGLPPVRRLNANDTQIEGYVQTQDSPPQNVDFYQTITHDYLETMDIAVVEGRGFEPTDDGGAVPVALVNETLARTFYPGENPIGRRLRPGFNNGPWLEIVGVVEDVKQAGLDQPVGTELYFHYPQAYAQGGPPRTVNFVVATAGEPTALAPSVRRTVWDIDGSLPVSGLQTMSDVMGDAMARTRFLTSLLAAFAGLALLLAAVGTYGVMSYAVTQRGRELGIRMAMGAEAARVQRLVLGEGLKVAAVGLVLGIAGAWALTGILESLLFGVDVRDPASFLLGPVILTAVAVVACWIPARRATRVDPVTVLREE